VITGREPFSGLPQKGSLSFSGGEWRMRVLQRFNEFLMKVGTWGTILFMAVMAIVVPYEVIGRYVFRSMTIWSGEVSMYSLAWASMLGGAVGLKKGYMISMTSVVDVVPPGMAKAIKLISCIFSLFFFAVMFFYGFYQTLYNAKQTSPAIGLVMSVPYAALPSGFFILFFFMLEEVLLSLGLGPKPAAAKGECQ
jgi:TRAP-type C4-dicarboxylate transport system permease small subunit